MPKKKKDGRYRKIESRMWGDEKFRALTPIPPCGQGLWIYLLTGPRTTQIPGIYQIGKAALAEELNWEIEEFEKAFEEIRNQGMAKADWKSKVIFIPKAIVCNKPASGNVVLSWKDQWDLIPECSLKIEAYEALRLAMVASGEDFIAKFEVAVLKPSLKTGGKASPQAFPKGLPLPFPNPSLKASGNQEQEQEQEQEYSSLPQDNSQAHNNLSATTHTVVQKKCTTPALSENQQFDENLEIDMTDSNDTPYKIARNLSNLPQKQKPMESQGKNLKASKQLKKGISQNVEKSNKVSEIFRHWQCEMKHPQAKLDNDRKLLIQNALKNHSQDEICRAITGCSLTPHNMGFNDRGEKYDGLHVILKNSEQIERFIRNYHSPPSPKNNSKWSDESLEKELQKYKL